MRFVLPIRQGRMLVLLRKGFGMTTTGSSSQVENEFFERVFRLDARDVNLLSCLMHKIAASDLYGALELIAYRKSGCNNIQRLAYALARSFHFYECLLQEELKVKGYDLLRQIVQNICNGLWPIDTDLGQNRSYQSLNERLFKKHGLKSP